jgi:hypothetical protein
MSIPVARVTHAAARVLLSGIFVVGGLDAARHPSTKIVCREHGKGKPM